MPGVLLYVIYAVYTGFKVCLCVYSYEYTISGKNVRNIRVVFSANPYYVREFSHLFNEKNIVYFARCGLWRTGKDISIKYYQQMLRPFKKCVHTNQKEIWHFAFPIYVYSIREDNEKRMEMEKSRFKKEYQAWLVSFFFFFFKAARACVFFSLPLCKIKWISSTSLLLSSDSVVLAKEEMCWLIKRRWVGCKWLL